MTNPIFTRISADGVTVEHVEVIQEVLTKREQFAMAAMQGLLAFDGGMAVEWNGSRNADTERHDRVVWKARKIADALIAELSK